MPWRNGGGATDELWREPPEPAPFDVRVSAAAVASDGPFSLFPGVDRVILLVRGAGFELSGLAGQHVLAEPGVPFAFAGETPWACRLLAGPVADLNVMVRRATGLRAWVRPGAAGPLPAGARFVYALGAGVAVEGGAAAAELPRETLGILEAGDIRLHAAPGAAVVIGVEPAEAA
jgi:hypothetical protein